MKERPILLNAEMVRAVLDGRKTQTRRILTPRQLKMIDAAASIGECYPLEFGHQHENSQSYYREWCPFGAVGDRLWVRETWARYNIDQDTHDIAYRATTPDDWPKEGRWRPSIHMPRWASRITLEITGVRVERLKCISEEDARAEGAPTECCVIGDKHFLGFRTLWRSIYGEESWQANPFVWVIEFKRVEGEA
ncbi:morphogenetic protein [Pantoea ananatis]|uniref:hypothetical protein n=1 Tax=Pantoea ananas TaxID=553 RepID=UPI000737A8F3|nr:hypothetical protein [Pantoea ananatis]KTR47973.1 morphogenetic protein [Pantoea ananatis]KTR54595.1 morphogenetic protein [Pantoea ananatis]KTR65223.1 morphogenetic protein [Pantoea ananatis]KTR72522.1 morphogenetic protein [Pantoea ananatis]